MNTEKIYSLMEDAATLEDILDDFDDSTSWFEIKMESLEAYSSIEFRNRIESYVKNALKNELVWVLAELKENLAQHSPDETAWKREGRVKKMEATTRDLMRDLLTLSETLKGLDRNQNMEDALEELRRGGFKISAEIRDLVRNSVQAEINRLLAELKENLEQHSPDETA